MGFPAPSWWTTGRSFSGAIEVTKKIDWARILAQAEVDVFTVRLRVDGGMLDSQPRPKESHAHDYVGEGASLQYCGRKSCGDRQDTKDSQWISKSDAEILVVIESVVAVELVPLRKTQYTNRYAMTMSVVKEATGGKSYQYLSRKRALGAYADIHILTFPGCSGLVLCISYAISNVRRSA